MRVHLNTFFNVTSFLALLLLHSTNLHPLILLLCLILLHFFVTRTLADVLHQKSGCKRKLRLRQLNITMRGTKSSGSVSPVLKRSSLAIYPISYQDLPTGSLSIFERHTKSTLNALSSYDRRPKGLRLPGLTSSPPLLSIRRESRPPLASTLRLYESCIFSISLTLTCPSATSRIRSFGPF